MRNLIASIIAIITFTALIGCAQKNTENKEEITAIKSISGTVTYRQRIALPPDAELIVELRDVSRQDAPAAVIASQTIPTKGRQVPIPFSLSYNSADVDERYTYAIYAAFTAKGKRLFMTTTRYPVITQGYPTDNLEIVVAPIAGSKKYSADAELENTYWKLIELKGNPVSVPPNQREPHIKLNTEENRAGGSGGCNRFFGGYEIEGNKLRFSKMGATMMSCPSGMEQERDFLQALETTTTYKIEGDTLELYADETLLARFKAVFI